MNELTVPPSPKWFQSGCVCTPDNGFLYAASFSVVYIPPASNISNKLAIRIIDTINRVKHCDSSWDWSKTKFIAYMNETLDIYVHDLDQPNFVRGHKCHEIKQSQVSEFGTFCFTKNNRIYSVNDKMFVDYCVVSNTHKTDEQFLNPSQNRITILKSSPYNPSILACGTKTGLVLIADVGEKAILFQLRGHDDSITALDWLMVDENILKGDKNTQHESRHSKKQEVIVEDLFDIYASDTNEYEFGTIRDVTTSLFDTNPRRIDYDFVSTNENFNFAEECQNLRSIIEGEGPSVDHPKSPDGKDYVIVDEDNVIHENTDEEFCDSASVGDKKVAFLASGSRDPTIWIWNADNGTAVEKLTMKSSKNSTIPNTYTCLAWIDDTHLISNDPNGSIIIWDVKYMPNNKLKLKNSLLNVNSINGVTGLCLSHKTDEKGHTEKFVWTNSIYREIICTRLNSTFDELFYYCTLAPTINSIAECPLDLNKIGIAAVDKRISVLNISNMKPNKIVLTSLLNKIHSKVLSLSWHPTKENILAFGTNEGQVGFIDTSSSTSTPTRMKPFFAKPVYSLSWGYISVKQLPKRLVLFACGDKKLAYFPGKGDEKHEAHPIICVPEPTEISCCDKFIAVGTKCGWVHLLDLDDDFNEIYKESISLRKLYVSSISWNPINVRILAAASMDQDIRIINLLSNNESKTLSGHTSGVASVKWSFNSMNKLVSASFDHSVRVWDTNTQTTISIYKFGNCMFSAIFSPIDDHFIICGGKDTTLNVFDSRLHNHDDLKAPQNAIKVNVQWSSIISETKASKSKKKNKSNKNKALLISVDKVEKDLTENFCELKVISDNAQAISINSEHIANNLSTIMYLTNKEMNSSPIYSIMNVLDTISNDKEILHEKLFSLKRSDIEYVLNAELKNIKLSSSTSKGRLILPQFMDKLKDEIIEKIEKKILTEEYIALAPYVSYNFWQRTCRAYAYQCLENGFTINAIPFLIASHEINEAIESLCKSHHFREAWIICKLYKESEDPLLNIIFHKWTTFLDTCGNYLAAALLFVCKKEYTAALEILCKIKTPDVEVTHIIDVIREKLIA